LFLEKEGSTYVEAEVETEAEAVVVVVGGGNNAIIVPLPPVKLHLYIVVRRLLLTRSCFFLSSATISSHGRMADEAEVDDAERQMMQRQRQKQIQMIDMM